MSFITRAAEALRPANPEAREVIAELGALDALPVSNLASDEVRERVRLLIGANAKAIQGARRAGRSARDLCLCATLQLLTDDLASGQDHIYRGVLSVVGKAKLEIWDAAFSELITMGLSNDKVRRERRRELDVDIEGVG